jgi:hypothetical protein
MIRPLLFVLVTCIGGCFAGEVQDRHASVVDSFVPAPSLDLEAPFSDPDRALGPADGRTVALGLGSALTLRFFRDIPDGRGPDLRVVELGPDGARAWVAVSADGVGFVEYAEPLVDGDETDLDLADVGLTEASFVRLRGADEAGIDPGFDLDALEALH